MSNIPRHGAHYDRCFPPITNRVLFKVECPPAPDFTHLTVRRTLEFIEGERTENNQLVSSFPDYPPFHFAESHTRDMESLAFNPVAS